MPFHFKRSESLGQAVQRLCRKRIAVARTRLGQGARPKAIHGLRKDIKWLRAALRLVKDDVSRPDYRKVKKGLRLTAKNLAGSRDARVMLRAFKRLTSHTKQDFAGVESELHSHLRDEKCLLSKVHAFDTVACELRKTKRRLKRLRIHAGEWADMETALRQSYLNSQTAWKAVQRTRSDKTFHEWRKQVKNLWYQLCLISPSWSDPIRAFIDHLEQLGEQLGEDHDLTLLEQFIADHADSSERQKLGRLIAVRRRTIRNSALKLGGRIFAEKTEVMCSQLRREWNSWRQPGED